MDGGVAGADCLAARMAAYRSTSDELREADRESWWRLALKVSGFGCSPEVFDVIWLSHWYRIICVDVVIQILARLEAVNLSDPLVVRSVRGEPDLVVDVSETCEENKPLSNSVDHVAIELCTLTP